MCNLKLEAIILQITNFLRNLVLQFIYFSMYGFSQFPKNSHGLFQFLFHRICFLNFGFDRTSKAKLLGSCRAKN